MTLFQVEMRSEALNSQQRIVIMTPELTTFSGKLRTMFFLHGARDDASTIFRKTDWETFCIENNIALVTADGYNSFYTNTFSGENFGDFFESELTEFLTKHMQWYDNSDGFNYIGGISMGANGALKLAFKNPAKFRSVWAFSPPIDIYYSDAPHPLQNQLSRVFGEESNYHHTEHDLTWFAKQLNPATIPPIHLFCGTEDFVYPHSVEFDKLLTDLQINHAFESWRGDHNWHFWNQCIERVHLEN
jgi:S-formylglutathione hydrolase FrmB